MKLIRWVFCGSAVILACVLTRADEPGKVPGPETAVADAPAPDIVVKVYSIGDLIHIAADRPIGSGAVPPTQLMSGELIGKRNYYSGSGLFGGSASGLFGGSASNATPPTPAAQTVANASNLMDLIQKTVDVEKWGLNRSILSVDDVLVVRQTLGNHRQIAELLDQLREHREASRSVTIQADWLLLSPGELSLVLRADKSTGPGAEVDPAALSRLGPSAFYARGRLACMGGQTTHILSGRVRTLVENLEATVGTASSSFQPEVEEELSGAALQLTPHIQGDSAIVDVVSFVGEWNEPDKPYRIGLQNFSVESTTQPSPRSASSSTDDSASIDRLNSTGQQLCATTRVPLGKPTLIGGMTLEPDSLHARGTAAEGRQIYLVLRVDAR